MQMDAYTHTHTCMHKNSAVSFVSDKPRFKSLIIYQLYDGRHISEMYRPQYPHPNMGAIKPILNEMSSYLHTCVRACHEGALYKWQLKHP